jgi:hypothetical protein
MKLHTSHNSARKWYGAQTDVACVVPKLTGLNPTRGRGEENRR